jgi:hypothetical protein
MKGLFAFRIFLFLFFTMLATPLEYLLEGFLPYSRGSKEFLTAFQEPLVHGALFFYALIISAEALLRLLMHPERLNRPAGFILVSVSLVVIVPCLAYGFRGVDLPLGTFGVTFQQYLAGVSLLISMGAFGYIHRTDRIIQTSIQMPSQPGK